MRIVTIESAAEMGKKAANGIKKSRWGGLVFETTVYDNPFKPKEVNRIDRRQVKALAVAWHNAFRAERGK